MDSTEGEGDRSERQAREPVLDRRAFEARLGDIMDRLYGTALRLTRDSHDAEDIVAEAVGNAWRRLDELRDPDRFEGWLFRILNNTFISHLRQRRCRQDQEADTEFSEIESAGGLEFSLFARLHQPFLLWWGTPEEAFVSRLLIEDIQKALDGLPENFRIVVVLVEVQGHTYDEVASLLDIPVGTVRSRLSRGRSLLQRALWEQARDAGIVSAPAGETPGNDGRRE